MDKLTDFKEFVKKNPSFVKYVKNNEMTWQKFYELYDLYGEEHDVWTGYKSNAIESNKKDSIEGTTDIFNWMKNIDIDTFQDGISSIQRVLGVLQDLNLGGKETSVKPKYEPRPLYKHFED